MSPKQKLSDILLNFIGMLRSLLFYLKVGCFFFLTLDIEIFS